MTVSILGCGWFGKALAQALITKGVAVKGSTTNTEKLGELSALGLQPYLIQFPGNGGNDPSFFDADVIVVSIPPKFRKGETEGFITKIEQIISTIKQHKIPHVIYTSSTAVYGSNLGRVTELDEPMPNEQSGKLLLQAEKLFQEQTGFSTTVIRFAGLIGPGRHPGRFFAGKQDVSNGLAPVNLVHLDDTVGIALAVIANAAWGQLFNACAPDHPARSDFYTLATQCAGLQTPTFTNEQLDTKIVESINIGQLLNYQFIHDKLMQSVFD